MGGGRAAAAVAAHHLTVGQDVGAAELHLGGAARPFARVGERAHDVGDRDRLRAGVQPARDDHHRQAASTRWRSDLERRAAGADDHRRAHVDQLGTRWASSSRDLVAGAQVRPRRPVRSGRGRQVDRRARRRPARAASPKLTAACAVAARRSPPPPPIEWIEVVGGADAVERLAQAGALDARRPCAVDVGRAGQARRVADERAHAPDRARAAPSAVGADVAGGAGERMDPGHRASVRRPYPTDGSGREPTV